MILEALLKLRQVCCDPRLVKNTKKAANTGSAKLVDLMQMVEDLLEEKRKILVCWARTARHIWNASRSSACRPTTS